MAFDDKLSTAIKTVNTLATPRPDRGIVGFNNFDVLVNPPTDGDFPPIWTLYFVAGRCPVGTVWDPEGEGMIRQANGEPLTLSPWDVEYVPINRLACYITKLYTIETSGVTLAQPTPFAWQLKAGRDAATTSFPKKVEIFEANIRSKIGCLFVADFPADTWTLTAQVASGLPQAMSFKASFRLEWLADGCGDRKGINDAEFQFGPTIPL